MKNRKAAEDFIIGLLKEITTDDANGKIYKEFFSRKSDKEFEAYINRLDNEDEHLIVNAPNLSDTINISVERNLDIGKKLFNHDFFQRIWIGPNGDIPEYLTPIKHLVMDLTVRRASQILTKKISIPQDNRSIDMFTSQPTGKSKGATLSYPELQLLAAMGMEKSLLELIKYRGGDKKGFNAMNAMINKYGQANIETLQHYAGTPTATKTFSSFLSAMHLKNNLVLK